MLRLIYSLQRTMLVGGKSIAKAELVDFRYWFTPLGVIPKKKRFRRRKGIHAKNLAETMIMLQEKMKVEAALSWFCIDAFAPSTSPVSYELLNGLKPKMPFKLGFSAVAAGIEINLGYNGDVTLSAKGGHAEAWRLGLQP